MTLIVSTPPGREVERRYVLDVVLTGWWGLSWQHVTEVDRSDVAIRLEGGADTVVSLPDTLFAMSDEAWLTSGSLPPADLGRHEVGVEGSEAVGDVERLPVLYGPRLDDRDRLVEVDEQGARVHLDVLGSVFFLLTRYEEVVGESVGPRDSYDRFPATASLAGRGGWLESPLADAYVELLWIACSLVWPRLRRRPDRYEVRLTHDVDDPLSTLGRSRGQVARQFAGDLVRRRDPGLVLRRARAQIGARRGDHRADPNNTFDDLMAVSEEHGLRSAFYFLAHDEPEPAVRHHLVDHPWVRQLVGRIHRRGHEVGFHAAFGTYRDPERTSSEFTHLRRLAEAEGVDQHRWGGRQHYLQWAPETWRHWAAAGLDYDATLAFPDAVGFRTGTCRPYGTFDLVERRPLPLVEQPFQVMDVTLFEYMALAPDDARDATLAVARECRRFRGTLGILWHNDSVYRTTRQKRWYAELVAAVTDP